LQAAADVPLQVSVRFVGLEEGRELNGAYRGKDSATNVLTFDYQHEPVAVADIVIATEVIAREAAEQGKGFRSHLAHLLVHGALHAQGWDHETDAEADIMEAREAEILAGLGFANPYSDAARAH
ncbi:MAG: rRNA maturation RNase YbeY, partial [Duodenibacillus sp.]|nr:rRNA maturation RNase YbeY [Duodenibacillus sp.]